MPDRIESRGRVEHEPGAMDGAPQCLILVGATRTALFACMCALDLSSKIGAVVVAFAGGISGFLLIAPGTCESLFFAGHFCVFCGERRGGGPEREEKTLLYARTRGNVGCLFGGFLGGF